MALLVVSPKVAEVNAQNFLILFAALQCCNNVVTIRNNVATMLQRCVVLKIVVANRLV